MGRSPLRGDEMAALPPGNFLWHCFLSRSIRVEICYTGLHYNNLPRFFEYSTWNIPCLLPWIIRFCGCTYFLQGDVCMKKRANAMDGGWIYRSREKQNQKKIQKISGHTLSADDRWVTIKQKSIFDLFWGAREWSQSIPLGNISPNMGSKVDFDEILIF